MKKVMKSEELHPLVSWLLSTWLRFIYATARVRMTIPEASKPFMNGEQQAIFCFWHGRMILNVFKRPKQRDMRVMISRHRDGQIITDVLKHFNIGTVRGSTKKGGDAAIREVITAVAGGTNIAITPDGPKGPAFIAQHGAAYIAQKTGLPLVPISFGASRAKIFDSWDKFLLPKPFSKVVFVVGEPLIIAPEDNVEERSEYLQNRINHVMQEADKAAA
ncbi:MAG: lysophospholipid acyltransferase family protein [Alphaproteobacteria bacterium]|nr:lysophospholipid acyltransferase family protein [Alphaproteobacteria bacterium]